MSRRAILTSLTLHGGILILAGWWSTVARPTPGRLGADASFQADAGSGSILAVTEPAVASEPLTEPQLTEPEFIPSPPAVLLPAPPVSTIAVMPVQIPVLSPIPPELPSAKPNVSASKSGKAHHRALARSGESSGGSHGSDSGAGSGGGRAAGYVPPQFLVRYKPLYPDEARAQRWEGTVLLLVTINAAGQVTSSSIQSSCGHAVLDRAALAAVRSWRFDPARQDGVAIAARVEVPVRFRFEERASVRS